MATISSSDKISSPSIINEDSSRNNNEIYEKVLNKDQAHGDVEISKDYEKPLEVFSYESQQKSLSSKERIGTPS
jgi:hypothetical protein